MLISPTIKWYLQQCILQLFYKGQDSPSGIVLLPVPHQDFTPSVLGVPSPVRPLPSPSAFQQWPTQTQSWYRGRGWSGCSHLSPRGSQSSSSVLGGDTQQKQGQSPAQCPQLPQSTDLPATGHCCLQATAAEEQLPANSITLRRRRLSHPCEPSPPRAPYPCRSGTKQLIAACSPQGGKGPAGSSGSLFTWYGNAPLILQAHQEALAVPVSSREVTLGSQTAFV